MDHGIQADGGCKLAFGEADQIWSKEIGKRSQGWKSYGGCPCWSHLLKASAKSLDFPAIWLTSTSMVEEEINTDNLSKNKDNGIWVLNNLLETDSAEVLPDSVDIRMGTRHPGRLWMTIYTKTICAKVSRLEISFCKSSCMGIFKVRNSSEWIRKENQLTLVDENCTNPQCHIHHHVQMHRLCRGHSIGVSATWRLPAAIDPAN